MTRSFFSSTHTLLPSLPLHSRTFSHFSSQEIRIWNEERFKLCKYFYILDTSLWGKLYVWCIHRILDLSLMENRQELWGKYTYVLNRLQGIIDPVFSKPYTNAAMLLPSNSPSILAEVKPTNCKRNVASCCKTWHGKIHHYCNALCIMSK